MVAAATAAALGVLTPAPCVPATVAWIPTKPTVMLDNAPILTSDAKCMCSYGGVISTGSFTLIDGSRVRRPFRGWRLPDGTDMEDRGAVPDIRVERTPADEASGRDRQLEVAVDDLLTRMNDAGSGDSN